MSTAGITAAGETALRHRERERGASMVEYILLVALIALAVMGAVTFLSGETENKFDAAGESVSPCGDGTVGTATPVNVQGNVGMSYTCTSAGGMTYEVFIPN